jgi:hypothetical protein
MNTSLIADLICRRSRRQTLPSRFDPDKIHVFEILPIEHSIRSSSSGTRFIRFRLWIPHSKSVDKRVKIQHCDNGITPVNFFFTLNGTVRGMNRIQLIVPSFGRTFVVAINNEVIAELLHNG